MRQPKQQHLADYPIWLDDLDPAPDCSAALPAKTDVLIIGGGYTGLNAAFETAGAGRETLVLDAGDPGQGCSTRNGGQISTSIKPTFSALAQRHGPDRARAIRDIGAQALAWIEESIAAKGIDCDFSRCGRFHAAHTPAAFEALTRAAKTLRAEDGITTRIVPREAQMSELGSARYCGGLVFPDHAALHPAKYHRGLVTAAQSKGATIIGHCRVTGIAPNGDGFLVQTSRGPIHSRDVIVATNGYTSGVTPWLRRRIIPIGSYVIATEPLPRDLVDHLFPTGRIASDTRKVVYYYRTSPDRRRIIFGGRVSANETDTKTSGARLFDAMAGLFPEIADFGITHSWSGTVAYTFDEIAHTGSHEGVHYAMGYCGSGVSMASYLGMKLGQRVLGQAIGQTALDDLPFPTRPFYSGRPWFLPAAVAYYRWRDNRQSHGNRPSV